MLELSSKISDAPSAKNLKRRSISAIRHWPPGCGRFPPSNFSSPCNLPEPSDVSETLVEEELEEGEIAPEKMPPDEGQNSDSAQKVDALIEEEYEGQAEEPLVAEGQNGKSVVESDGESNQWWMRSKVYPPPKRRSISAFRRYPPGCGRNLDSTVSGFDGMEVECKKVNNTNEAFVLGKDGKAVSDGEGGTNEKSKENGQAGLTGTVNNTGIRHMVDKHAQQERLKDKTLCFKTDSLLVKNLEREKEKEDADRVTLEEKTEVRNVEKKKVDNKISFAEEDRIKGTGIGVNNNSTVDSKQNKVVKPIKLKILFKEKKEEESKAVVPISINPNERAQERTGRDNRLAIKKSNMKRISNKRPLSSYNPNFPHIDRLESGDADLENYASHAILNSKKSSLASYRHNLLKTKHDKRLSQKSKPKPQASSSGLNLYQHNTTYFGPKKEKRPTDPRARVKKCLRLFQIIFGKLLQEVESGKNFEDAERNRLDLRTARIMGEIGEKLNRDVPVLGSVPGVEVGDEYRYRAELSVLGLHRPPQGGIDSTVWKNGVRIATSIVASGGYSDDIDNSDLLIYTGAGGKPTGKPGHTEPEDQKLERGNLALKNSIGTKTPVRVIHGMNTSSTSKVIMTFTYDGLYVVEKYWRDKEIYTVHGKPKSAMVFRFQLRRLPNQPEMNRNKLIKVQRSKVREGLCVRDISQGRENFPICVINTVDKERIREFQYITKSVYPSWYKKSRAKGCTCKGPCSDAKTCSCVRKNGGQIPYNFNGAIVQAKPLIYECGPTCGCGPSCHNRVSQHGIKFPLEIFKTETRGWGVRSLSSIPSGSFVCEYTGELLREQEAQQRENDEYLFAIGHNYDDSALYEGLPSEVPGVNIQWPSNTDNGPGSSEGDDEQERFTIDALRMGNVGRFVNHSCSPNLYAQNVLFDHDDRKMPHIMFFAAENIPPLMELTYHYNYPIGAVHDSHGNVKAKDCHCRSSECRGRLY